VWEVSFTEWAIQYWPVKMTLSVGALLLLLDGITKLIKDLIVLFGKRV
jgi:TRAP-type mannitol/chloroaromatic compound transport system permease small subunit